LRHRVEVRQIECVVAGVIDRNNDEAGVGERLCEIVISEERPAAPVRHDDEWQIFAADGTVLRGRQFERPDHHDAGGRLAKRPDAAPYLCPVAACRDIKKLKPGCLRAAVCHRGTTGIGAFRPKTGVDIRRWLQRL
jgi:hypothetical protein